MTGPPIDIRPEDWLRVQRILRDAFSESDLPFKVDIVDWATASETFRAVIERDRVVVQEAQSSPRIPGRSAGP